MAEFSALAPEAPGLAFLAVLIFGTGIVYGFAGFGTALIFMPLATFVVPPVVAVAVLSITAIGSAFTVLPGAWRGADRRASLVTLAAALVAMPFGTSILSSAQPDAIRWCVSVVVLLTLAALLAGWRYATRPALPAWLAVGGSVGLVGGATGLTGPVLVLFQLAGSDAAARTRANTIVVLTLSGIAIAPILFLQGTLPGAALALGAALLPVYAAGTWVGGRLFTPARDRLYRRVAYGLIGAAGVLGLPLFG